MCKPHGCVNVALSRIRRPRELHEWRMLGGPAVPLRNPALLFVHGDVNDARSLLPPAQASDEVKLASPARASIISRMFGRRSLTQSEPPPEPERKVRMR